MFPSLCKIKEKEWPLPPNNPKSPPNLCLHVFILRMIVLTLSVQSNLKVPISLRLPQKYQKETVVIRGQMPLTVNMVFNDDLCYFLLGTIFLL
jgi:hypothetical protein